VDLENNPFIAQVAEEVYEDAPAPAGTEIDIDVDLPRSEILSALRWKVKQYKRRLEQTDLDEEVEWDAKFKLARYKRAMAAIQYN
jgi:hypothetical protein